MKLLPTISIVVPIYKVEAYLNRCVKSIVEQTYTNIEIILVDDGSPEQCPALCDAWAEKDNRIRVIHKKNGGLSDARNAGIDAATGEYILFIDSDDYIAANMCQKMIDAAEGDKSDMVICGFIWKYPEKEKIQSVAAGNTTQHFSNIELLRLFFMKKTAELTIACNKLYRRQLFLTSESIRYPVGKLHEDEFTTYRLIYEAKKITVIPDALYYYVQRSASIMSAFKPQNLIDSIAAAESYIPWADEHHVDIKKEIACAYDILSYSFYLRYWQNKDIDPQRKQLKSFRRFIMAHTPCIYSSAGIPWKYRIWDFLLRTDTVAIYYSIYILKKKWNKS